jgi:predicted Zn-dependent protease
MKKFRVLFLALLIFGISGIIFILNHEKAQPPFSHSLSPLYVELGKPVKSIDRVISRIYPINEIDEQSLGDEIRKQFTEKTQSYSSEEKASARYLNSLITSLTEGSSKPFKYTVFLIDGPPNAFAYPGGVIFVTKGLLKMLQNEAELIAILGHEVGHIERGHLFDATRNAMLQRKIHDISLPNYATEVIRMLLNPSFSKTQEDEADEYGFRMLLEKKYDPFAMNSAFEKLIKENEKQGNHQITDPIADFFASHPYIELRKEKFYSRAKMWKIRHPKEKMYRGKQNLANQVTRFEVNYPDEWREE